VNKIPNPTKTKGTTQTKSKDPVELICNNKTRTLQG